MEIKDLPEDSFVLDQLTKYAKDLSEIYKSEKGKRKELENARQQLKKYAEDLAKNFSALKNAHQKLQKAYIDTINRLALAAEYKDEDTGDHIVRIGRYCGLIAEKFGLPAEQVQTLQYASPMHDIGKIGIPDSILSKPGKLTEKEFDTIKEHTIIGAKILQGAESEILNFAEMIALSHHEKWNGNGYPQGLSGYKIPLIGRIVSLADVFDALTSRRPYKDPFPIEKACDIIKKDRGEHFDPDVVDIFQKNIDEILKIKTEVDLAEGP